MHIRDRCPQFTESFIPSRQLNYHAVVNNPVVASTSVGPSIDLLVAF